MNDKNGDGTPARGRFWRRKRVWVPTALAVFLILGHTAWWFVTASVLDWFVATAVDNERARGTAVTVGDLVWNGYPLAVRADATDVQLVRADGLGWQAPALSVETEPLSLDTVRLALDGEHRVLIPAGFGQPLLLTLEGGKGKVSFHVDGSVRAADVMLNQLALAAPRGTLPAGLDLGAISVESVKITGGQPNGFDVDQDETALTASIKVTGIHFPEAIPSALGHRIDGVGLAVKATGPLPIPPVPPVLSAWSANGGKVQVEALTVAWGALSIKAQGPVSLDAELQPSGVLTAEVRGALETIDGMVEAGIVRKEDVGLIRGLVQGMTIKGDGPDAGTVKVPVAIRNQFVWLGPFKLLPLPRIDWGGQVTLTDPASPAVQTAEKP